MEEEINNINNNTNENRMKINPFLIGGVILGFVVMILLIVSIMGIFRFNEYGEETKIDNFDAYYGDASQQIKDLVFNQLYVTLFNNSVDGSKPPESGAMIREDTAEYDYDEDTKVYTGIFIVDIASVEQSYKMEFSWSPVKDNQYLDGYPVIVTCVPRSLQIYESDGTCEGTVEIIPSWENGFQLDYTFGNRTSGRIQDTIGDLLVYLYDEEDEYNILIDAPTLERDKSQPDMTFSFSANMNQKYSFDVVARTDDLYGDEYIVLLIDLDGTEYGYVIADDDTLVDELSEWLVELSGDEELAIGVEPLELD